MFGKIKTLLQGSTLSYPSVSWKSYYHWVKSSLTYTWKYYDRIEITFYSLKHEYFLTKLFQTLNKYGWMGWFFPTNNTYIRVWNTTSPGREARIILCPISMQTPKTTFFDCGQTRTIVVEYYHVRNIFDLQNSIWFPSKLLPCCRYYILCCGHEFNFTMFDFP